MTYCVRQLHGHNNGVYSLQLGEGGVGFQLASGSEEGVRLWDIRDGRCISTLTGHTRSVYTLMFKGNRLITGAGDCAVKVWDLSDFSNVQTKVCYFQSCSSCNTNSRGCTPRQFGVCHSLMSVYIPPQRKALLVGILLPINNIFVCIICNNILCKYVLIN